MDDDRTGCDVLWKVAEGGKRRVLGGRRDSDLQPTIDEGLRMVVLDWRPPPPTLVTRLADVIRSGQREASTTALTPCGNDSEVGAHPAAGFFIAKPCHLTQIRRVLALACSPRTAAVGHVPKMPVEIALDPPELGVGA